MLTMRDIITDEMAKDGGMCPFCLRYFRPNGVGPIKWRVLTSALNSLPSSHALKFGANFHDWAYHFAENFGTRLEADNLMLEKNKMFIESFCFGCHKTFYHLMNYRNYWVVRVFGEKIWRQRDCK
jgi:hypothetical protein